MVSVTWLREAGILIQAEDVHHPVKTFGSLPDDAMMHAELVDFANRPTMKIEIQHLCSNFEIPLNETADADDQRPSSGWLLLKSQWEAPTLGGRSSNVAEGSGSV
jgi:hypothetical protein